MNRPLAAWIAITSTLLLGSCGVGADETVAAIVNGYRISYAELERYYQSQLHDQSEPPSEEQARMMRLSILREVIDRHILLQKADGLGLSATDAEIEERFRQYRAPFQDEEDFLNSLSGRGLTVDDLRTEIRRSLTIDKLLNREITARVNVSDAEMRQYYEDNRASFSFAEQQLHLAQILVTPYPENPVPNMLNDDAVDEAAAKAKIQMIEERLANGEDFAELALNYSEDPDTAASGGDMGFIPQSALERADLTLRRVVAALSPGDVSPVVETGGNYRIIKLIAHEAAGQRDFSDPRVQQRIRDTLLNRKDQLLKAAFLEVARSEANVQNLFARKVVSSYGLSD